MRSNITKMIIYRACFDVRNLSALLGQEIYIRAIIMAGILLTSTMIETTPFRLLMSHVSFHINPFMPSGLFHLHFQ